MTTQIGKEDNHMVKKIILSLLVVTAFCFARQCKWTEVAFYQVGGNGNFLQKVVLPAHEVDFSGDGDRVFEASYECDDGYKGSTTRVSFDRLVRSAENNTILYFIRTTGASSCMAWTFIYNGTIKDDSAIPSKCGL
jgi:hypothetical protein